MPRRVLVPRNPVRGDDHGADEPASRVVLPGHRTGPARPRGDRGRRAPRAAARRPDGRDHRGRSRRGGEVQGPRVRRADHRPRAAGSGAAESRRDHHTRHPPRRLAGRSDLPPAAVVCSPGRGEVPPRGDLGLRRRADAHGRRRQLRQHPPGPLATPGRPVPAHPAPGTERVELPALDLSRRDRRDPRLSGLRRGTLEIEPRDALPHGRGPSRGRGEGRRPSLPEDPCRQPHSAESVPALPSRLRRSTGSVRGQPLSLAGTRAELPLHQGRVIRSQDAR